MLCRAGGSGVGDATPEASTEIGGGVRDMQGPELSLVVPFFNEEDGCAAFFARVVPILESLTPDYEIVCVNDGSTRSHLASCSWRAHLGNPRIKMRRPEPQLRQGGAR